MRQAHRESMGRRGFGIASELPALTEEINVADFNGNAVIDITTIGGLGIDNFTHIQIKCDALTRSGTGSHMTLDFRPQGGAFGTVTKRMMGTNSVTQNVFTGDINLTGGTGLTVQECILWLTSINQPCPTGFHYSNQNTGDLNPGFIKGMTTTGAQVHDAIRFRANGGGGSETWVSGKIVITGYRCKVGTLYTGTFAADASVTINLAAGEYIADAFFHDVDMTTNVAYGIRVGNNDTFIDTSTYRFSLLDAVGSGTGNTTAFFMSNSGAQTGKYAVASLFNLNTSGAPVCMIGQLLEADGTDTNPQEVRSVVRHDTTAYTQLQIFAGSSTIASGTYYIQTYKPRQTIHLAQDLTGWGSVNIDVTGLKKSNASLLVCCSIDLVRAAADSQLKLRVGDSGGFDSGASDSLITSVDEAFDQVAAGTNFNLTDFVSGGRAGAAHMTVIVGVPQNTKTQMIQSMDMTSGLTSNILAHSGSREARQVEDRIGLLNAAQNFSGGTEYVVGYSM